MRPRRPPLANVALAVFALALILLVGRVPWWLAMLISWVLVLLTDLGLARVQIPAWLALVAAVLCPARRAVRPAEAAPGSRLPRSACPGGICRLRAVATAVLVVLVTAAAEATGPALAGVFAPFPIALSVVCAFAAANSGHPGVIALLRGIVPGLDGFALFCFVVAITIERWSAVAAFGLATAVAVAFALILIAVGNRQAGRSNSPDLHRRDDRRTGDQRDGV